MKHYEHQLVASVSYIQSIIQTYPILKNIFQKIQEKDGRTLLVGGAVRDFIMGIPVSERKSLDIDFEVYGLSLPELQIVLSEFGTVHEVGKSFGVLKLVGMNVDWSIPRTDSAGRAPKVTLNPHLSYAEAFKRRDFTMNAIGIDVLSGDIIDPWGGVNDIRQHSMRPVDTQLFIEDPLRFYRVLQFLGRFELLKAHESLDHVAQTMDLSGVSKERIVQEYHTLFLYGKAPSKAFYWLRSIGRLQELFPVLDFGGDEEAFNEFCNHIDVCAYYRSVSASDAQYIIRLYLINIISYSSSLKQHETLIDMPLDYACIERLEKELSHYESSTQLIKQVAHQVYLILAFLRSLSLVKHKADVKKALAWFAYRLKGFGTLREMFQMLVVVLYKNISYLDDLYDFAKELQILDHPIAPLITAELLRDRYEGAKLGAALQTAYEIQINQNITRVNKLLRLVHEEMDKKPV